MKNVFFLSLLLIFGLERAAASGILVLPFSIQGLDSSTQTTINELFLESFQKWEKDARRPDSTAACHDRNCALALARQAGAREVIFGSARKLGSKWIVAATRVDAGKDAVQAYYKLDCKSDEDFDPVMGRLAQAIAEKKTLEEVATIDNVTDKEMDEESHRRRTGFFAFGPSFGYSFPVGANSYLRKLDDTEEVYYDSALGYNRYRSIPGRVLQFKQILNTDIINWFELHQDLALAWDVHIGWGAEAGTHFTLMKLFSRGDFAPYAGAGLGVDYVWADLHDNSDDKANGGLSLNARAGLLSFRTYDFRLMTGLGYKMIFNHDVDQSISAEMALMWKKSRDERIQAQSNPLVAGTIIVGGVILLVTIIAAISN